jgi:hypothetical protein
MAHGAPRLFDASIRALHRVRLASLSAATVVLFAGHAYGDATVSGSMDSARLEAHDSSVAEVLNAVSEAFSIRYRSSVALDHPVTGIFEGPALKIISRVLQDYDYMVRRTAAGELEVVIVKLAGRDSSKVISTIIGPPTRGYPSTEVNTGNPAIKGGPYPHPLWRARSYSRTIQPAGPSTPK